jgi:uncharacterized membrane protein YozB (DUF420 family)
MMVDRLLGFVGLTPNQLPAVNAAMNAFAALLLIAGYVAIRRRNIRLHKTCMMFAFLVSTFFLASYLYFHIVVKNWQPTRFTAEGWPRRIYFAVLLSHTILAALVAILAPVTLILGFGAPGNKHLKIARWTFPIWLYVSITGVVVYWMLYQLYPPA